MKRTKFQKVLTQVSLILLLASTTLQDETPQEILDQTLPFKIALDTYYLDSLKDVYGEALHTELVERWIGSAIKFLEKSLRVYALNERPSFLFPGFLGLCGDKHDLSHLRGRIINAHMLISVSWEVNREVKYKGLAATCYEKVGYGRTLVGAVRLNIV